MCNSVILLVLSHVPKHFMFYAVPGYLQFKSALSISIKYIFTELHIRRHEQYIKQ